MHLVHNEKTKLHATFLNNLSVGLALGGCALPFLGYAPNTPHVLTTKEILRFAFILVVWVVALLLHRQALRELEKLHAE